MAAQPIIVIGATTSAATHEMFVDEVPATFSAPQLATTETVKVQVRNSANSDWTTLQESAADFELDAENTFKALYSPMHIRLSKSTTAAACAVQLHKRGMNPAGNA